MESAVLHKAMQRATVSVTIIYGCHVAVTSRLHSDLYPTCDVRVFPGSRCRGLVGE